MIYNVALGPEFYTLYGYRRLDLIGEVTGLGNYDRVIEFSEVLDVYGIPCHVMTLEGLIVSKKAAGHPKDLRLIPELEALLEIRKSQAVVLRHRLNLFKEEDHAPAKV